MFKHLHRWAVFLLPSPKPSCFITIFPAADEGEAFEVREMCGSEGTRSTDKKTQKSLRTPLVMQKLFHRVADAVGTHSHPLALPVSEQATRPPAAGSGTSLSRGPLCLAEPILPTQYRMAFSPWVG